MKKKILLLVPLFMLGLLVSSCKKSDSNDDTKKPDPVPVVNPLCDGNSSASYFPLVLQNTWTYYWVGQTITPKLIIKNTNVYNSKTYMYIDDDSGFMTGDLYLREESSTHDIYAYNSSTSSEYLYLPGSPTLNQLWNCPSGQRKVTSISATYSTSSCSYSGLLEISRINNGTVINKSYYKKGLGLVASLDQGMFATTYKLDAVTLK